MTNTQAMWVDSDRCTGCGDCVEVCPTEAIALVEGKARVDEETCIGCGACADECPQNAIQPVVQGELVPAPQRPAPTVYRPGPLAQTASAAVVAVATGAAPTFGMSDEETPIHLVVLNGTSEFGLARGVGLLLGRVGCVAERVGNAPHRNFVRTFLVNRRLSDRQAADLARRLGGIRVIREWDGRGGEDAILILGADCAHLTSFLAGKRTIAAGSPE